MASHQHAAALWTHFHIALTSRTVTTALTRYTGDTFGLRTADEAGKNSFESFKGQHIRFTEAELNGWLDKYFV